jgi:hypothetical protein
VKQSVLSTPRPVPSRLIPVLGAAVVVALALPVFIVADWPLRGWALGAVLWAALTGLSIVIAQLRKRAPGVSSSVLHAVELFVKAVAVLAVVVAAAKSDRNVAIGAVLVYALAYTLELALSVATYFGSEK